MPKFANLAAAATAVAVIFVAGGALAQQVFVSGHGTDSGTCTFDDPCRTFAYALTQAAAYWEIVALDDAGYGPVTIDKPITIQGGRISVPSNTVGITIGTVELPRPAVGVGSVTLRGLILDGGEATAGNATGILLTEAGGASTISILGCVIENFGVSGTAIQLLGGTTDGSISAQVVIADSTITGNQNGIVSAAPANLYTSIYRTIISNNAVAMTLASFGETLLESSHVDNNGSGITIAAPNPNYINYVSRATTEPSLIMKQSSALLTNNGNSPDITNSGTLSLYDQNTIGSVTNNGTLYTDDSNNIGNTPGGTVTQQNLQ
jgi:hypothetical protein